MTQVKREGAERRFNVWLADERPGLSGKVDLLLRAAEEVAVVDFKLTSGEPRENHRMQLAGYSLLAELACGVAARRAFNSSCHPTGGSRSFTTDRCQGGG